MSWAVSLGEGASTKKGKASADDDDGEEGGWDADDDLDLGDVDVDDSSAAATAADSRFVRSQHIVQSIVLPQAHVTLPFGSDGYFVPPTRGVAQARVWANNSQLAGDHAAAGSFDTAMQVRVHFFEQGLHALC
jgi:coatomer protein complex subunit alpha (xenin)